MRRLIADWMVSGSAPVSSTRSSMRSRSRSTPRSAAWLRWSTVIFWSVACAIAVPAAQRMKPIVRNQSRPLTPALPREHGGGRDPWRIADAPPNRRAHARAERGGRAGGGGGGPAQVVSYRGQFPRRKILQMPQAIEQHVGRDPRAARVEADPELLEELILA